MSEVAAAKSKLTYIPSLDGIRGLFCFLIIINHWKLPLPVSPTGWEVLQAFFVMSGYLITRILVYDRDRHTGFGSFLKSFYIKRTLRIFPLYFFYLFLWLFTRMIFQQSEFIQTYTQELANNWMYYFTYTSNLKALFNIHSPDTPFFGHLWSLGLEEQFYLIMPFTIFFFRGKWLKYGIVTIILLPFVTRVLGEYFLTGINDNAVWAGLLIYRNLPFQMDSFAFGALVAVFPLEWIKHPKRWLGFLFAVFMALTVYHYFLVPAYMPELIDHYRITYGVELGGSVDASKAGRIYTYIKLMGMPEMLPMNKMYIYMMPLVNMMSALLILTAVRGNVIFPRIFENNFLIGIGKITYAMYVFHFCIIVIFLKVLAMALGRPIMSLNPLLHIPIFIAYLVILIAVSRFSFKYIETPFLKLKSKIR